MNTVQKAKGFDVTTDVADADNDAAFYQLAGFAAEDSEPGQQQQQHAAAADSEHEQQQEQHEHERSGELLASSWRTAPGLPAWMLCVEH